MHEANRTYLVGRRNSTVACDIALPESEKSVSRKHLELTVTANGRCYIVHVHPKNITKTQNPDGSWQRISQDYVELDTPLLLGEYRTTARQLLALHHTASPPPQPSPPPIPLPPPPPPHTPQLQWDPDAGTFRQY